MRLSKFTTALTQAEQDTLTDAGRVTAEMHWERIEYLLERMIPVAEECKVRMGNSQEDPATPPGYSGCLSAPRARTLSR